MVEPYLDELHWPAPLRHGPCRGEVRAIPGFGDRKRRTAQRFNLDMRVASGPVRALPNLDVDAAPVEAVCFIRDFFHDATSRKEKGRLRALLLGGSAEDDA